MEQHLVFLLLGLGSGAVYAALALALVVTYRTSGVVNFATGALAVFGAYVFAFLRRGELLLPAPFLPTSIGLPWTPDLWVALLVAVGLSALLGFGLYLGVFRFLQSAPPVAKAVASIGLFVFLTALFTRKVGTAGLRVEPILPEGTWIVGDVRIATSRVWMAATVVVVAGLLAVLYRRTDFGLVTRAVAESEKGAYVSGISPGRIAAANWMVSGAVAGLAGILIAPIVPPTPIGFTFFIVPALAAALFGRFESMLAAVIGGLCLGAVQSELAYLQGQWDWLPASGLAELVPLLLIVVLLVVQARPLPTRGAEKLDTVGRAPRPQSLGLPALLASGGGLFLLMGLEGSWRVALITSMIMAIIGLSLVVVTGFAGQVSLAQLTLAGVAGFLLSPLTVDLNVPFPLAPLVAAMGATVVGLVIGLPALRIRGLPLAVVTLALASFIEAAWFRNPDLVDSGGKDIAGPLFLGLDLRARIGTDFPRLPFGLLVLIVLTLASVGVARLRTSALGSQMLAVKASEAAAEGAGVDTVQVKVAAFAIGSFLAGIGGTMLAYFNGNVTFDAFSAFLGLSVFATAYIGGLSSVAGGLLGGFLVAGGLFATSGEKLFGGFGQSFVMLSGAALVLMVIVSPAGLVSPLQRAWERRRMQPPPPAIRPPAVGPFRYSAVPGSPVVLAARKVTVTFGGVVAASGVDLKVHRQEIVGLIGPNGAGKTSVLDALSGFVPCAGTVELRGEELRGLPPHLRARRGLGRTFQRTRLCDDLTVEENVAVGHAVARGRTPRPLDATLKLLGLDNVADRPVTELSQGIRQLVAIARALVGDPEVLLLDEPAGGLDTSESRWLAKQLRRIRETGVSILLVDHDMRLVMSLCDTVAVLDFGHLVVHDTPEAVRADRRVAAAYLGRGFSEGQG